MTVIQQFNRFRQWQIAVAVTISFLIIFALSALPFSAQAAPLNATKIVETHLNPETYASGITLSMPKRGFILGVAPAALSGTDDASITMRRVKKNKLSFATEHDKLKSHIYRYQVQVEGDNTQFNGPMWVNIKLRGKMKTRTNLVLKQYIAEEQRWEEIESSVGASTKRIRASLTGQDVILAAFRDVDVAEEYSGKASWYNWHGAAMNQFEMGDEVIVTNTDTGAEATTTIVSRGPYVQGRIIDLPADVFQQLAPLSQGVMNVSVRKK